MATVEQTQSDATMDLGLAAEKVDTSLCCLRQMVISLLLTKTASSKAITSEHKQNRQMSKVNLRHKHLLHSSSIAPDFLHMHAHISVVLSLIVKGEALSSSFAFIIAAALPIAVHIAPV